MIHPHQPSATPAYRALNYVESFAPREELIRALDARRHVDLVVVGGGVHGAWSALLAALTGLSVVLLEGRDYASQTSSRSSKMAHGGLRYLEHFDFTQVFEGIRQRDLLLSVAPHLVRSEKFLIPVRSGSFGTRLKLKIGLTLYDLFRSNSTLRHRYHSEGDPCLAVLQQNGMSNFGAFEYTDGLMDDTRLVFELIHAGREEGAFCLNHAMVNRIARTPEGLVVGWQDSIQGNVHEIRCGAVLNCAGPWVGALVPGVKRSLRFSRGIHVVFRTPWIGPSLLLPLPGEKGRYYFVWPHEAGTLVGTTEREEESAEYDPLPRSDEVCEIFERLARDLPNSGLNKSTAIYAFAGVRSLPLRDASKGKVSELSRRHQWVWQDGVLTLLGGKYTTAEWTAREGLTEVLRHAKVSSLIPSFATRHLPGAVTVAAKKIDEFRELCTSRNVLPSVVERVIRRYGVRAAQIAEFPSWDEILPGGVLRGEVLFSCEIEQAERVEDVLARRLDVESSIDHGLELVSIVEDILRNRGSTSARKEAIAYREKISQIKKAIEAVTLA